MKSEREWQPSLSHSCPPENCHFRSNSRLVAMIKWHQCIYIFNRENPQNSESPNGPRMGLDFIALTSRYIGKYYILFMLSYSNWRIWTGLHIVYFRRPEGSSNQAYSSCLYLRILGIWIEQPCFYKIIPSGYCRASEEKNT